MHELLDSKVFPPKVEETNRYGKTDKQTSTQGRDFSIDRADTQVQQEHHMHQVQVQQEHIMHQVQVQQEHSV